MEYVIKDLTQKAKDFRHWEKLSLMRGANRMADDYGKRAKEYENAVKILREGKETATENSNCIKPDVSSSVCACEITHENCDCIDTGICEICNKPISQTDC